MSPATRSATRSIGRLAIRRDHVVLALAVLAVAALPLSLSGPGWLRLLVIGVFLLLGPGTATLLLLRWPRFGYHGPDAGDPPAAAMMLPLAISLAMATSLAISTVVATVMLYAHAWHPAAGVMLLAVLVLLALVFDPQGIRRREARS